MAVTFWIFIPSQRQVFMKILQVITSLRVGGAEKLIVDMVPLYREDGYEADVLLFDGSDTPFKRELEEKGVRIFELDKNVNIYNPLFISKLIPYLKRYDVIHTHNTACQYFTVCAKMLTGSKVKLVTTEHSTTNRRRSIGWLRPVDRFIYGNYDSIISISDSTTDFLGAYLGRKEKIRTIYNGIPLSAFLHAESLSREKLGTEGKFLITLVAGFREQKDQDTVIRAMAMLPETCSLCLVGDGVRRSVCEQLVKELHLEQRVVFLGVRGDVPCLLKTSDVVVMSSHCEGFGLAAVEGMAAGKPVIASDVPGLAQVVSGAGILFPVGDARRLACEIARLMHHRDYYRQIAGQCLQRAFDYDIRKTADAYEKVYESVYRA